MKYYITTPIYYVNDSPHIGHAYTTIAADVLARWQRIRGSETFFLTGTDEHGAKICQAAEKAVKTPKEFCDIISQQFREAWQKLNITNDYFVRTTDELHEKAVSKFLTQLFEKGAIAKGKYEGLYCVHCEKFLSEADLVDSCCPDHKQKPTPHSEENYFFKLSQYQEKLLAILSDENHPQHIKILPKERRNEILGKLKLGLEDISISRANLAWGIPLPFDKTQTAYVWVDALINYISAIGYDSETEQFKKLWPAEVHLMAKDILWFHSVIWPAMLLAADLPLPKKVFAHGFFTINGNKMSKTLGNVIAPAEMIEKYGVDGARYLTLSLFPFGTDGDISWEALNNKFNTDLANNLGNLVSRTLTMIEKYYGGKIPQPASSPATKETLNVSQINSYLDDLHFNFYFEAIQKHINFANQFIETSAPWKMAKENNPELTTVLWELVGMIKTTTVALYPVMPGICAKIWQAIGEGQSIEKESQAFFNDGILTAPVPETLTDKGTPLFPRIVAPK